MARVRGTGASGFDRTAVTVASCSFEAEEFDRHRWRTNKKTNLGLVPLPIRKDFLLRVVMIQLRHGRWVNLRSNLYISVKHSCEN